MLTRAMLDLPSFAVPSAKDADLVLFADVARPLADAWGLGKLGPREASMICGTEVVVEGLFNLSEFVALISGGNDVKSIDRGVEVDEDEVWEKRDGFCDRAELVGLIEDVEAVLEELDLSSLP